MANISRISGFLFVLGVLITVAILAGCSTLGEFAPKEVSVQERSQARWDAIVARDFSGAWTYYTPGFRQTTPVEDYQQDMGRRPVNWDGAEVQSISCQSEDRCIVEVEVSYRVPAAPTGINRMRMTRTLREQWLLLDEQWWYVRD